MKLFHRPRKKKKRHVRVCTSVFEGVGVGVANNIVKEHIIAPEPAVQPSQPGRTKRFPTVSTETLMRELLKFKPHVK